jgi:hypothetical protein
MREHTLYYASAYNYLLLLPLCFYKTCDKIAFVAKSKQKEVYTIPLVQTRLAYSRFAAVVEEALQEICLVEFTSCVCTICLLEYFCIVVR